MSTSSLRRSLARASIWLYPPLWRERYAGEVRDLIEIRGATWGDVVGLLHGAIRERLARRCRGEVDWGRSATGRRFAAAIAVSFGSMVLAAGAVRLAARTMFPSADPDAIARSMLRVPSTSVVYGSIDWFGLSLFFAMPGIALALLIGWRWPTLARILVAVAFTRQALVEHHQQPNLLLFAVVAGCVFATVLFPRSVPARAVRHEETH